MTPTVAWGGRAGNLSCQWGGDGGWGHRDCAQRIRISASLPPRGGGMGRGGVSRRRSPTIPSDASPKRLPSPPWGGDGGGGQASRQTLAVHCIEDHLHHALDIPRHLRIPEPQDLKSLADQPLIPPLIPLPTMPAAINLDHQPPPQIGEVRDERPDGRLPPEMQTQHPVQLPQLGPDHPLLRRHLRPQLPRPRPCDGVNTGHPSRPMPKAPHPNPPHAGGGSAQLPVTSTHPNRKSASPPPRGEGLGVGGLWAECHGYQIRFSIALPVDISPKSLESMVRARSLTRERTDLCDDRAIATARNTPIVATLARRKTAIQKKLGSASRIKSIQKTRPTEVMLNRMQFFLIEVCFSPASTIASCIVLNQSSSASM